MGATALAVAAAIIAGCGGDTDDSTEAQPVPGATVFQEGAFDELPRYPGADDATEPAVEDDVTSQSFTVAAAAPLRVIRYYDRELAEAGWTVVEEPTQRGAEETYRGVWRRDDQRLVVSATIFRGVEVPGPDRVTQYSLSLGPAPEP